MLHNYLEDYVPEPCMERVASPKTLEADEVPKVEVITEQDSEESPQSERMKENAAENDVCKLYSS